MVAAVPQKAAFYAACNYWIGNAYTFINGSAVGTNSGTTAIQYDGEMCAYRELDRTGDTATWNPIVNRLYQEYDYYVNTIASPAGGTSGHLKHCDGLAQDVIRATARSAAAQTSISNILTNSVYQNGQAAYEDLSTIEYSREVAYAASAFLAWKLIGQSLDGTRTARFAQLITWAEGHLDLYSTGTGTYTRPFMVALTAKTLIAKYEQDGADATIVTKIGAAADYIWSTCWKSTAGAWGVGGAFLYTDRTGFDALDGFTQPDLNMLIAPMFGWLWSVTGEQKWRDRGDAIFAGGIPVYSGAVHVSGSYQGTPSVPAVKQIFQQSFWGHKYISYAEIEVNPVIMTTIETTSKPSESFKVTPILVNFAAPDTDYTIATPSTSTKRIVLCGAVYQEADAHTLTFKSGSATIANMQRAASDGNFNPISENAYLVSEPGEALKVRSSAIIVDILFYTYECTKVPLR
jgi:hypothetical protein